MFLKIHYLNYKIKVFNNKAYEKFNLTNEIFNKSSNSINKFTII